MAYFPDLLEEYKQLLKQMKSEGVTSGELYREVKQAVEWMETGYDPAEYRAATRVDAYPMDPYHMQTYMAYVNDNDILMPEYLLTVKEKIEEKFVGLVEANPEEWQDYKDFMMRDFNKTLKKVNDRKAEINSALRGLSETEKAVFIAIEAERLPFSRVANMLGIAKGTVDGYYRRAKQKIKRNVERGTQETLFDGIA